MWLLVVQRVRRFRVFRPSDGSGPLRSGVWDLRSGVWTPRSGTPGIDLRAKMWLLVVQRSRRFPVFGPIQGSGPLRSRVWTLRSGVSRPRNGLFWAILALFWTGPEARIRGYGSLNPSKWGPKWAHLGVQAPGFDPLKGPKPRIWTVSCMK